MSRGDQMREGSYVRWSARFGMSRSEVDKARELALDAKISMAEACRLIVRDADRLARLEGRG